MGCRDKKGDPELTSALNKLPLPKRLVQKFGQLQSLSAEENAGRADDVTRALNSSCFYLATLSINSAHLHLFALKKPPK